MNDSLRTNVFVRFSPETISCSCIFLAARQLKVSGADLWDTVSWMLSLLSYLDPPAPASSLVDCV